MINQKIKIYLLLLFIYQFVSISLLAQDNPIKSLDISLENNQLIVTSHFQNLIRNDMKATLMSGLSSSLHFQLRLIDSRLKIIKKINETMYLRYNVWEKFYAIRSVKYEKIFTEYSRFDQFLSDSVSFNFGFTKNIPPNARLQVLFSYSPERISESQKTKLNYWLLSEGEINESQPARESESGFSFSLSGLLSIFFSKKESSRAYIFKTQPFTIQSVMRNENVTR